MMILSEKLLMLRTKAGLSQEELAEKLNVSRQSVSKWESGTSIPGIDKILEIARIYGISTDYLLKDDIEELPGEVVADIYQPEVLPELSLDYVNEYLSVVKETSQRTALGVALCILSPVPMFAFLSMFYLGKAFSSEDAASGIGVGILLAIIAAAVIIFILNGMQTKEYEFLERESFQLSYGVPGIVEKEEREYRPKYHQGIAFGVGLCVASAIPLVVAGSMDAPDGILVSLVGLLLTLIALGVYMIVHVSIQKDAYDKLLERGDFTPEKKLENKRLELFDGIYWGVVTAVYLGISFYYFNWDSSWIIWPVAGVAYAAARAVAGSVAKG